MRSALPAAVFRESDPRSINAARVVPETADLVSMGDAILGYRLPARTKTERQFSLSLLRLREIEVVIRHRHGIIVPDPCDTDDRPLCLAYGHAVNASIPGQDLTHWSHRWMPWVDPEEIAAIEQANGWRRQMAGADDVAELIYVRLAERQALGLRTIGACDVPDGVRREAAKLTKREKDKQRQADKRRAEGRVDRDTYLQNSLSAQEPWDALGWSRAKYYRLRETGVSPTQCILTNGDGLVSPASEACEDQIRRAA